MLLSLNWLKKYIDFPDDLDPQQLAQDLTMSTVEVEQVGSGSDQFQKMVVGRVMALKAHANADKLQIAMTDVGKADPVQIVCGGTNLRAGMLVAVALPGSQVRWHGEGDLTTLKEAKIRGESSFGMICSSNEIGLDDKFPGVEMEIMDLSNLGQLRPGESLAQALGLSKGLVIEIDNKSLTHRPDLWNHYGIARELSAIYKTPLKNLELFDKSQITDNSNPELKVEIKDKDLCSRYIGVVIKNIKITPSPDWLVQELESVGSRGINNVVDITNYVMQDVGEPMHAFDKSKISDSTILVRRAHAGENMKTLDGEERKLDSDMLVIADTQKPVALAGIMGGASSEVSADTTELILEAATFDPVAIRQTAQKLNHRTESSIRFEKSLDYNLAELAMLRVLQLIKEIIPEAEITAWVDVNFNKDQFTSIEIKHSFLEKRIGTKFKPEEIKSVLERLGFGVEEQAGIYQIKVPSWRATGDISIPEDIVEEVARIHGYDNLREKTETIELAPAKYQPEHDWELKIKNYLSTGAGLCEVFNYPWSEIKFLDQLKMSQEIMIEIANPPSPANPFLQTSLIPNLIKNITDNLRYFPEFGIFELSRVYLPEYKSLYGKDKLPAMPKMLAAAIANKEQDVFLQIKGILEKLLTDLGFKNYDLRIESDLKFLNKEKSLIIMIDKQQIGWLGELSEKIKNKNVALFEFDFDKLVKLSSPSKKYIPLPQFPTIERDIAVELDWSIKWADLKQEIIKKVQDNLISNIEFLSEFNLGNKKSLAFRITYQADRTLKDSDVEPLEQKIIKNLEKKFNATLRK